MRSLDELLAAAADADGLTRITFRDPIAAFGEAAIVRLEPWLSDPRLAAFAVRTIERAAAQAGAAPSARAILTRARGRVGETIRRDIDEVLARLRSRSTFSSLTMRGAAPRRGQDRSRSSRGSRAGLPATFSVLRDMTPGEVWAAVDGFSVKYAKDWDDWLSADRCLRPELFGQTLRKWQATRGVAAMRRLRAEATHDPPYLDNLLDSAMKPLSLLGDLTVMTVAQRTPQQGEALIALWDVFSHLTTTAFASCVGITKAVLLVTDGTIGPALDNQVRMRLGVGGPAKSVSCADWLQILQGVGDDVAAFESAHGPLVKAVPARFAHLEYGRLCDMALGPR